MADQRRACNLDASRTANECEQQQAAAFAHIETWKVGFQQSLTTAAEEEIVGKTTTIALLKEDMRREAALWTENSAFAKTKPRKRACNGCKKMRNTVERWRTSCKLPTWMPLVLRASASKTVCGGGTSGVQTALPARNRSVESTTPPKRAQTSRRRRHRRGQPPKLLLRLMLKAHVVSWATSKRVIHIDTRKCCRHPRTCLSFTCGYVLLL